MSKTRLLAAFVAAAAALTAAAPTRAVCNPFQATFETSVGPENPTVGTLFYNIQSTCKNRASGKSVRCGGQFSIPPFTALSSKCNLLVAAIQGNSSCVDTPTIFTITNNCGQQPPSFTVTDPACTVQTVATDGLLFGIANQNDVLGSHPENPSALVDYEFDTITQGCPLAGHGDFAVLQHNASGTAISGAQTPSVFASVDAPGGFSVTTRFNTHAGDTPTTILNALAAQINSQSAGVSCQVVMNRAIQCTDTSGGPLEPGAIGDSAPLSLQLNDVSLSRMSMSGPPALVQQVVQMIDTPNAPLVSQINVVSGASVPALSAWAMLLLTIALATIAALRLKGRGLSTRRPPVA